MSKYTIPPSLENTIEKMSFQELVVLRSHLEEFESLDKAKALHIYINRVLNQRAFNMVEQVIVSEK